jgi:hypothetical protein
MIAPLLLSTAMAGQLFLDRMIPMGAQSAQFVAQDAMDQAMMGAVEESLISWIPKGNANFLEAMPRKAARAILKMQTSPYWRVRDRAQQELRECGVQWNYWALHYPSCEVVARTQANLYALTRCQECEGSKRPQWGYCQYCWGVECFYDFEPFLLSLRENRSN